VRSALQTRTIKVRGITCMDCVTRIAHGIRALPGVQRVSGNLDRGSVKVVFDAEQVPVEEILRAIERTGYAVEGIES
jgi:copper ion binding protein